MDIDAGGVRLSACADAVIAAGVERMRVDLGLETDRGRRFAIWSLLFLLGSAPDLETAFENPADREAARNFMDMMEEAKP
ncbi:hypothetical protein [Sphingobium ummariense]|nr:hypothetical protein [Sphingobium ummariense]